MKQVIVYDFDKTLTYKDTLFGFFKHAAKKDVFYPAKLFIYMSYMVNTKLGIASNDRLKSIGIKMFLHNLDLSELEKKFESYHETIKFNKIFDDLSFHKDADYYIVSASFEEYLKPIFPKTITVLGSKINYKNNKAKDLGYNCYKENKVSSLKNENIEKIDILYTDSYSDYALAEIAEKIIIIKDDEETVCNNIDEFKRYFNK